MKIGDTEPVYMAGQVVAQAKVAEFDNETATLIIPATRVVMAVRTSLEPEATPEVPEATGNEHVMLGVENQPTASETATVGGEEIEVVSQPQVAPVEAGSNGEGETTPQQSNEAVEVAPEAPSEPVAEQTHDSNPE